MLMKHIRDGGKHKRKLTRLMAASIVFRESSFFARRSGIILIDFCTHCFLLFVLCALAFSSFPLVLLDGAMASFDLASTFSAVEVNLPKKRNSRSLLLLKP